MSAWCEHKLPGARLPVPSPILLALKCPNAQIVIKDLATGVERTVRDNKEAFYIAANLLPAEYQVTVTATGFNTEIRMD